MRFTTGVTMSGRATRGVVLVRCRDDGVGNMRRDFCMRLRAGSELDKTRDVVDVDSSMPPAEGRVMRGTKKPVAEGNAHAATAAAQTILDMTALPMACLLL